MTAIALLAVCSGFTFPESHYTIEKTFVKAPSPQTEISAQLCDDVEDSNDLSTGAHFFQGEVLRKVIFFFDVIQAANPKGYLGLIKSQHAYLLYKQFLI